MSKSGSKIQMDNGKLHVPNDPIIPFIEGDGIGPDIWRASVRVFDAAVEKAYQGERKIHWLEVYAGQKPSINSIIGFQMKPLTNAENIWSPLRVHLLLQ